MTIDTIASLQLAGNMPNVVIHATEETTVTLQEAGGEPFMVHRYQPDGNGRIEINLRDIVIPRLTFHLQDSDTPYRQTDIVKQFTLTATMDDETDTLTFDVLRAGIENLADSVGNFLTGNFLTWQPNCKPVTYYTPEFLTYYAVSAATIKCTAHKETGDVTVTLATIPAGQCWTVPVQYGIIAGKVGGYPLYYDVWAEVGGSRATYIQRYYASDMKSEEEQWVLFENSLGGIDCFRAYGDSENTAEHTHNIAEIEEDTEEYRVDTQRKFKKNTGHLGKRERLWLLDFFPSLGKYIYAGSFIRKIVVTDSDVSYQAKELPSSYTFTYKFATARPYLNIPRADTPSGAIDITLPDQGSFSIAPRLAEFPRTQLSGGALFPVQSPYSDTWGSTTMAAILTFIARSLGYDTEGGGFTPPGISEEEVRQLINSIAPTLIAEIGSRKFLSKEHADTALGLITFAAGLTSQALATFVQGLVANGLISANQGATFGNFIEGMYGGTGGRIDAYGNGELESLRVRSTLEVLEMIINRLQAQEGDTLFSDNDQIEDVEQVIDDTDQSVSYILTLKEKWDGYVTGQMYGNIIKGIINTLAARQAGVSDVTEAMSVEVDGSNKYYTSWMRVIATHNTSGTLGVNQIQVVLYGDDYDDPVTGERVHVTPAGRNYPPCKLMTIARWGCIDYSDPTAPDYEAVKASIVRRQRLFMISTSDGRVIKHTGVDSPILKSGNYGVTIGELPEFVKSHPKVREILNIVGEHTDWLYAQGIVVGNFVKIDAAGLPMNNIFDCGTWMDGTTPRMVVINPGTENEETISVPSIGHGIYLYNEYNPDHLQWETHEVSWRGMKWRCLQHQPVISGGVTTYYEPKWNSPYWLMVEGISNLTMEFASSRGFAFRRHEVDTVITPHVFYGGIDITDDLDNEYFSWTRSSESGKTAADETWDAQHVGQKALHLTLNDMPATWSSANKAIFTCVATVNDGKSTRIVDNQIIS